MFATLALVNEVRWDSQTKTLSPSVRFEVGRRLTTSTNNKVSPSTDVTPDCTIQCNPSQGIVAEAKLGLPRNPDHWEGDFEQLLKYDDELVGWWNAGETIDRHDIVALVPIERAVPFTDNLQTFLQSNRRKFERKTSVVGFFKKSGVKDFVGLKKEWGSLSDSKLDSELRKTKLIAFDILLIAYRDRKFVDSEPPLVYLLQIIWDYILTVYAAREHGDNPSGSRTLNVTVDQIADEIRQNYGFPSTGGRSPEIPKTKWVTKALNALVDFGMAKRIKQDHYEVIYKRSSQDTLKKFGYKLFKLEAKKRKAEDADNMRLPLD